MSTTLTAAIVSARLLVGDGPTDNLIRNENMDNADLGNIVNGSNRLFSVTNFPITPSGTVSVVADGAVTTSYSVNEATGQFTLLTPPNSTLQATYYFYLMPDASWTEFFLDALENLGYSTSGVPAADILAVPEGLLPAVKAFACAAFCMRLSVQTGLWYNQRLQEREEARDSISKKFMALAQEWEKRAMSFRDQFYSGQGTQLKPSLKIINFTPRQYTPYR